MTQQMKMIFHSQQSINNVRQLQQLLNNQKVNSFNLQSITANDKKTLLFQGKKKCGSCGGK